MKIRDHIDGRYLKIGIYAAATIVVVYTACMLLSYSGGFFAKLWELASAVIKPMVYGALISYLFQPLVKAISDRLGSSIMSGSDEKTVWNAGVAVAMLFVAAILAVIIAVLLVAVTRSLSGVSIESLQALIRDAQADFESFSGIIQDAIARLGISGEGMGQRIAGFFSGLTGSISPALFAISFAIYYLLDGNAVGDYGKRVVYALVGDRFDEEAVRLFRDADKVFSGYIRGQFVDAFIVAAVTAVVLSLLRVPYGAVCGILMGVGNLIPYVGGPLGIASVVLTCLARGDMQALVLGLVAIAVIWFVDGNIINPRLLSENVDVHPLLVMAALIAGGAIGGLAGMLVAVPAAAFLKLQLDRWLESRGQGSEETKA